MAGGHARPKSRVYAQRAGFRSITLRTSPAARSDWSLSADRRDVSHHSTRGPSSPHAPSSPRPRKQAAAGGWRHGRSSAHRCGYTTKSDAAQPRGRARRGITICQGERYKRNGSGLHARAGSAWQQAQHRRTCAQQRPPAAVPWRGQWQGSCVHGPEGSSTTRTKVCLVRFPHSRHMGTCRRYQGGASARGSRPAISSRMVVLCRRHWDSNFCVERHHAGGRYKAACGRGCSRALSPVELDPFLWSDRRQLGVR